VEGAAQVEGRRWRVCPTKIFGISPLHTTFILLPSFLCLVVYRVEERALSTKEALLFDDDEEEEERDGGASSSS
jgi:hypothetical protein